MFIGMHHFSLCVSDLDRSIAYYKEFGFMVENLRYNVSNDYFRKVVAFQDGVIHTAMLKGTFPVRLELMQYVTPKGIVLDLATPNVGSTHICFIVDDIYAEYERLKNRRVCFKSPVIEIDEGPSKGACAVYLLDPDGYTMELLQLNHLNNGGGERA